MTYAFAYNQRDCARIDKLNKLINAATLFDDVRKFIKNVRSDYVLERWTCLADQRYAELITGCEDVRRIFNHTNGKFTTRYFDKDGNEVFVIFEE